MYAFMRAFIQPPDRLIWTLLAGVGLLVPALVAKLRFLVLHNSILVNLRQDFIPIGQPIHGIEPHPFYSVMHNLTHPILLLVYAVVFTWLPLRASTSPLTRKRSLALFLGVALLHGALMISYCVAIHLPVGDLVCTIKP
jgi:hypothetical protein